MFPITGHLILIIVQNEQLSGTQGGSFICPCRLGVKLESGAERQTGEEGITEVIDDLGDPLHLYGFAAQ